MKLRRPTDFLILQALHAHGRNVATNLAKLTGKSRKNINTRMPVLADYGLVTKIGPADHSGLYDITALGERALRYADRYDEVDDFERLLASPSGGEARDAPDSEYRTAAAPLLRGRSSHRDDDGEV